MGILNMLKHFVPLNARVIIYNCLLVSHLNHKSSCIGPHLQINSKITNMYCKKTKPKQVQFSYRANI